MRFSIDDVFFSPLLFFFVKTRIIMKKARSIRKCYDDDDKKIGFYFFCWKWPCTNIINDDYPRKKSGVAKNPNNIVHRNLLFFFWLAAGWRLAHHRNFSFIEKNKENRSAASFLFFWWSLNSFATTVVIFYSINATTVICIIINNNIYDHWGRYFCEFINSQHRNFIWRKVCYVCVCAVLVRKQKIYASNSYGCCEQMKKKNEFGNGIARAIYNDDDVNFSHLVYQESEFRLLYFLHKCLCVCVCGA